MKIFVAGATGFIGSILVDKLIEKHYGDIYALCRNVSDRKITLNENAHIIYGDITDTYFINKCLKEIKPDIVVHLAAPSSVAYSHDHAQENVNTTILGTINLQRACLNIPNFVKFIYAGTSEEYGNQTKFPIKESSPLLPNQPYALAKVAADNYLQYCKESQEFPLIILRPFNTYGRTKNFTFVTESIIYQMLTKKEVSLGSPEPIRDLMYVGDHVDAYLKAIEGVAEKMDHSTYNICTGIGVTIQKLAQILQKMVGFSGDIKWNSNHRPTEIYKLIGDNSSAKKNLGWEPKVSLEKGLLLTVKNIKKIVGEINK